MWPSIRKFINREKELNILLSYAMSGGKVLIKGRRGIGKSVLAIKLLDELVRRGISGIYINCLTSMSGRDLLKQLSYDIDLDIDIKSVNNKEALDLFFKIISKMNIEVIVFDEFTNLFRVLGRKKDFGNITNFAAILRGYIIDSKSAIIATSSGLSETRHLVRRARILGRTFDFVLVLEPFDEKHAIDLVHSIASDFGETIPNDIAEKIVVIGDFVPFYIEALTRAYILYKNLERAIETEFTSGTLSEYFMSLYEDLSPTQRQIMLHLGYGRKKYEELVELIGESDVAQGLSDLIDRDLVAKIYISRKNVFYTTKDRTFASWVVYHSRPIYTKQISELLQITTLGFEAFVRETLGALTKAVKIKDVLGRVIELGPFVKVSMQKTRLGQIDIVAISTKGETIIGECYFGANLTTKKIKQILKYKELYPIAKLLVIYKGHITKEAKTYAKKRDIYLIDIQILREIRKSTPLYPF